VILGCSRQHKIFRKETKQNTILRFRTWNSAFVSCGFCTMICFAWPGFCWISPFIWPMISYSCARDMPASVDVILSGTPGAGGGPSMSVAMEPAARCALSKPTACSDDNNAQFGYAAWSCINERCHGARRPPRAVQAHRLQRRECNSQQQFPRWLCTMAGESCHGTRRPSALPSALPRPTCDDEHSPLLFCAQRKCIGERRHGARRPLPAVSPYRLRRRTCNRLTLLCTLAMYQ